MVRASAKNFESVAVVVNPERYGAIVDELALEDGITRATRFALAAEAFAHTAAYDAAVAGWFAQQEADADALPDFVGLTLREGRGPALRGEPAPARRVVRRDGGPGRAGRRRGAPRQGDVVQQLARRVGGGRARARVARRRLRDREAQQPVRGRGARRRGRLLPRGLRVRRGQRVRRHRGLPRRVRRDGGRGDARGVHRGRDRAVVHRGRSRVVRRATEPAGRASAAWSGRVAGTSERCPAAR